MFKATGIQVCVSRLMMPAATKLLRPTPIEVPCPKPNVEDKAIVFQAWQQACLGVRTR